MNADTIPANAPARFDFEVLHRNIILEDRRRFDGYARVVRGDVARLTDGRLMARWPVPTSRDALTWGVAEWSEDHDVTQPLPMRPVDWDERIDNELGRSDGYVLLNQDEPPAIAEIKRFRAEWPHVAQALGLEPPPAPERLFDPGRVYYPRPIPGGAPIDWRGYLEAHCSGAWGLDGEFTGEPLTEDQAWTIELQPVAVQNHYAIATGRRVVRSRHLLPAALQAPLRARDEAMVAASIVTCLDSGRTLMRLEAIDSESAAAGSPQSRDPATGGKPASDARGRSGHGHHDRPARRRPETSRRRLTAEVRRPE